MHIFLFFDFFLVIKKFHTILELVQVSLKICLLLNSSRCKKHGNELKYFDHTQFELVRSLMFLLIDLPDDTASDGEYCSNGNDSDMLESGENANSQTNKCSDLSESLFFNC